MNRWYYFIRNGDRFLPRRSGSRTPPRPADAHPANGDPLTPWYEQQDHCDAHHIHVLAASREDATKKAAALLRATATKDTSIHAPPSVQNP